MMTNCFTLTLSTRSRRHVPLVSILTLITSACTSAATTRVAHSPARAQVPGIPNQPDLVTVIPFYEKANENETEKTRVVFLAEVDGHRGMFVLDLGAPPLYLNRTFLRPGATDGVDTVLETDTTDTHRRPDWDGKDRAHVTLRLGTLIDTFVEPTIHGPNPRQINAFLDHSWDNFGGDFAPRLGHISLSALEPFETIIDYTHRRVVLIRLDKAGHRLTQVPAYTPKWSAPLIDVGSDGRVKWVSGSQWWGMMVRPDSILDYTLDTLNAANNTLLRAIDTGYPTNDDDVLGYPFLSRLGVFGVNHRTHQFILYH
jgi:hypothetical protein